MGVKWSSADIFNRQVYILSSELFFFFCFTTYDRRLFYDQYRKNDSERYIFQHCQQWN